MSFLRISSYTEKLPSFFGVERSQKNNCVSRFSFPFSHFSNIASTQAFNLLPSKSGSKGLISRWSRASFLPSLVILSILSTLASTIPLRTFSALSASSATIFFWCSDGFTEILWKIAFGTGRSSISAVFISATSLNIAISSGRL